MGHEVRVFPQHLAATNILDYGHPSVRAVTEEVRRSHGETSGRTLVQIFHRYIEETVRPVYVLNELQPVSVTFGKGSGSCSQRIACLEACSRSCGIPTRVRGLRIDGRFWYPRFRSVRFLIPKSILLAWPQFFLDGPEEEGWVDFDELFVSVAAGANRSAGVFTNTGETLFEAVRHTAVDFMGKTRECGGVCVPVSPDLSRYVLSDEGFFNTRDELFARFGNFGQTWRGKLFEAVLVKPGRCLL